MYTRAYDRAAIKFRGLDADINFVVEDYKQDLDKVIHISVYYIRYQYIFVFCFVELIVGLKFSITFIQMKNLNKVEFVQTLRRESASFGRGSSKYKGLTLQKNTQLKTHHDQIHLFQNRYRYSYLTNTSLKTFQYFRNCQTHAILS